MTEYESINTHLRGDRIIRFTNCILVDNGVSKANDLWIRNGKIIDGQHVFYCEKRKPDLIIDCEGKHLCPGFIDLQINGGCGMDFTTDYSTTSTNVKTLAKELLKSGVTFFCPTLVTTKSEVYKQVLPEIQRTDPTVEGGAGVLGAHLEGPFINPGQKGAHDPLLTKTFEHGYQSVTETYGPALKNATIMTLAPELQGSVDVIRKLTEENICVSLGHSMANLEQGEAAVNAGARMITHLFNAMISYHHRDPHLVGLLTSYKIKNPIYFGIIADAIHTHPSALRLAWSAHPSGLVLVTDAMAAYGLGAGTYNIGNLNVKVMENGRAVLADHPETLAGSTVTMPQCISNLLRYARCSLAQAIRAATRAPAEVINSQHGTLSFNTQANLVLFDVDETQNVKVCATFTQGLVAYVRPGHQIQIKEQR